MKGKLIDLLTRPDVFFTEEAGEEENLMVPILIVLAGAVMAAIYGYQMGALTARLFSSAGDGIGQIVMISSAAGAFIFFFLLWVIITGVFYLLSMAFKGTGSFRGTLSAIGYGTLPQVIGSVITIILAGSYLPRVVVHPLGSLEDPQQIQAAVQEMMANPVLSEFTRFSSVISVLFLLWSANIWIFALRHRRHLGLRDAVLTVMIPVGVFIIYTLYGAFVGFPGIGGQA